jgi:hypothetical protein
VNDDQPGVGIALFPAMALAAGCGSTASENTPAPANNVDPKSAPPASAASSEAPVKAAPHPKLTRAEEALATAATYLFRKQQDDGSWPSDYKQLEGTAITSLVVYALSHLPEKSRPPQFDRRTESGLGYLTSGLETKGYVVRPDGTPDYPTYASALTLVALHRLKASTSDNPLDVPRDQEDVLGESRVRKLFQYLIAAQIGVSRSFLPDHPHLGGWDMTGDLAAQGVTTGTNISVTCFAVEALSLDSPALGSNFGDPLRSRMLKSRMAAQSWLARCQNRPGDGGFFFHPDRFDPMNKAGWEDKKNQQPRSYGTATCDGLRALLYCGAKLDDPRAAAALAWLAKHDDVKRVPGFEKVSKDLGWHEGLRFYYYATLAKLLAELPPERLPKHRQALPAILLSLQHPDGRWQNTSTAMREDDPILATSFAMIGLSALLH